MIIDGAPALPNKHNNIVRDAAYVLFALSGVKGTASIFNGLKQRFVSVKICIQDRYRRILGRRFLGFSLPVWSLLTFA